ncbi:MAG TPA: glycosyltransferase family 2 protein [Bryobacteraceae bacterium]|jgi:dolichol-phosphate mannosyltransferase
MLLSVVIPVFNEAEILPKLLDRLAQTLIGTDWEVIFVDDGSTDGSLDVIRSAAVLDERIKAVAFTRNFGHQAAITAGLDFANGDAVAVMDADLQDPPELLPRMLELLQQGYDVVSPKRIARPGETLFKRVTAALFYRAMARLSNSRLTADVGDFRLFSRRAVLAIRGLRERHRFMRGLVAWLGLKEAILPFERQPRTAGETKYPLSKMLRFAWTAISSFSVLPLRLSIAAGLVLSAAGFGYLLLVLYLAFFTATLVPGWASIVVLQCLFSGMILLALGAIGDYVARTYEEGKGRPLYVVTATVNDFASPREVPGAAVLPIPEVIEPLREIPPQRNDYEPQLVLRRR